MNVHCVPLSVAIHIQLATAWSSYMKFMSLKSDS